MKRYSLLILITCIAKLATAQTGNVGIGTSDPKARLHVADSSVLFSANGNIGSSTGNPPVSGAGRRMMWYADKAAFRAGYINGTQWNKDSVGYYSIALGFNVKATNNSSIAVGASSTASGPYAIALGTSSIAEGYGSFAAGFNTKASGDYATTMGSNNISSGYFSMAGGLMCSASGEYAVAMGHSSVASGTAAFAIGNDVEAPSTYETVVGTNNLLYTPVYASGGWSSADRIFTVGNGTGSSTRSNALTIFKNGRVGIGTISPDQVLTVNGNASKPGGGTWATFSDARVKKNVQNYTAGLREILAIRPVSFQYNELSGYKDVTTRYVGVLAQDMEKILPATVTICSTDTLVKDKRQFDASELTYTLINAVKEQQAQLNAAHRDYELLKRRFDLLEAVMIARGNSPVSLAFPH